MIAACAGCPEPREWRHLTARRVNPDNKRVGILIASRFPSQHELKLGIICEALILAFLEKSIATGRPVDQINVHWLSDKAGYVADDRLICQRRPVEWMHTSRTQSHP
jgi:hypothetical protein